MTDQPEDIAPVNEPRNKKQRKNKAKQEETTAIFDLPHHFLPVNTDDTLDFNGDESELDEARISRILGERARAMAKPLRKDDNGETDLTIVSFTIAGENYAFNVQAVRDIQPVPVITPVPCTPSFVAGIVNLRGRIISVLDIRRFLGLENNAKPDYQSIVVVAAAGLHVGLLVDEVSGVDSIHSSDLRSPNGNLIGLHADYIQGLLGNMRALLDLDALLANPEIVIAEEV